MNNGMQLLMHYPDSKMRLGQIRAACCTAFGTDPRNGSAPVSFCTMAQYHRRSGLRIRTRCGMQLAQCRSRAFIFSSYVAPIRCRSVPDLYRLCAISGTEHSQIASYRAPICHESVLGLRTTAGCHDDTQNGAYL